MFRTEGGGKQVGGMKFEDLQAHEPVFARASAWQALNS